MPTSIRTASTVIIAILVASASSLAARTKTTDKQAPTKAAAPGDACSLFTKEEAAKALGEAVTGPKATVIPNPGAAGVRVTACEYVGSGLHRVQLTLRQLAAKDAPMYRAMCAEKKSADLAGIGDVACWYNEKHEELHALKGTAFLTLELEKSGDPTEAIKGLMKQALARLR